ncbi:MAG: hypothetical protein IJD92_00385 [Bacilli bacterium]|nr:hypothetical protein [Bacilli bacterium]
MNIIFLDVDGVLNSIDNLERVYKETNKPHSGFNYPFDEMCLGNLKILVEKTNAKLVITSIWRKSEIGKRKLLEVLKKYDLDKYVIGFTEVLNSTREEEIKKYLSNLEGKINYIILDDKTDFYELASFLVNTNIKYGLTKEDVEMGIKKLTKNL